jgi:hypothetical protein
MQHIVVVPGLTGHLRTHRIHTKGVKHFLQFLKGYMSFTDQPEIILWRKHKRLASGINMRASFAKNGRTIKNV